MAPCPSWFSQRNRRRMKLTRTPRISICEQRRGEPGVSSRVEKIERLRNRSKRAREEEKKEKDIYNERVCV